MTTKEIYQCQCENCQQPEYHPDKQHHHLMNLLLSRLNEQQRRWYVAVEAEKVGHGGTEFMSVVTGIHVNTIRKGRREIANDLADRPHDRIRVKGGGRKPVEKKDPEILTAVAEIVTDDVAGDPMSQQKWVRRSLAYIARQLAKRQFRVGPTTVRRLLKKLEYGLYSNRKSLTGVSHADRDKQFRYIRRVKQLFLAAGHPVISVDTKKKELVGCFRNQGRQWRQQPEQVNVHDFRQDSVGRAVPYGIYDLTHNQGAVYVGNSYDTSEFAAHAIAQWWADPDRPRFRCEDKLLILADAGGSNNCRYWLWKQQIQTQLADQFGIEVMICHYPTGASKWNPVEYRLFSQISRNWAGKPLRTWELMLTYIRGTVTETGLKVRAFLVDKVFEKRKKVSAAEKAALHLQRRPICPTWNYVLKPRPCSG